ncbi:MAG: hypothetical protein A2289_05445 [Deltaproteobacteria bacterium RIFOXYA12_FULL_58_15]|nr:MAG: hypothetical protein A2289_05445 [Deltaproteobacteria bacterium RIFOXYA12_FULL_58_15]OGR09586.1 MAG: hypothetical protein A2341_16435 [Deltaproteobacteria bacterium RIFOXYB12_FULL_58_9]
MALNIKSREADELARELSRRRQQPITRVIIDALKGELSREKARARPPGLASRLLTIGSRFKDLPTLDDRSDEKILGYDEMTESW